MREILLKLGEADDYLPPEHIAGFAGEHNAVRLSAEIPSSLLTELPDYYRMAFKTGFEQEAYLSQKLFPEETMLHYDLPQDLMVQGTLSFQICAYKEDALGEISHLFKGKILSVLIDGSIFGTRLPQGSPENPVDIAPEGLDALRLELLHMAQSGTFDGKSLEVEVVGGDRLRVRAEGGVWQYTESLRGAGVALRSGTVNSLPSGEASRIEITNTDEDTFISLYLAQNGSGDIQTLTTSFNSHTANQTLHKTGADALILENAAHYKGFFLTSYALSTAHPSAVSGDFAIVGTTDTVWLWDGDNSVWINAAPTGGGETGGAVTSVNDRTGDVVITATDVGAIASTEKGTNNGVATLTSAGKLAQMPTAIDVGALSSTGTASAAAKLATARSIGSAAFDGSANITLVQMGAASSADLTTLQQTVQNLSGAGTGDSHTHGRKVLWTGTVWGDGYSSITLNEEISHFKVLYAECGYEVSIPIHTHTSIDIADMLDGNVSRAPTWGYNIDNYAFSALLHSDLVTLEDIRARFASSEYLFTELEITCIIGEY